MAKNKMAGDVPAKKPADLEAQIHLEMDIASYDLIIGLVEKLEAASISEVIRRAIQTHEFIEPIFDEDRLSVPDATDASYDGAIKTLHVRIPMLTKKRLDIEKSRVKGTYSDVIIRSIMILDQLVDNRSNLIEKENNHHANDQYDLSDPARPDSKRGAGRLQTIGKLVAV